MPNELLPCRCGYTPRICYTGRKWLITCDTEDCAARKFGNTKEGLIEAWNTRTNNDPSTKDA